MFIGPVTAATASAKHSTGWNHTKLSAKHYCLGMQLLNLSTCPSQVGHARCAELWSQSEVSVFFGSSQWRCQWGRKYISQTFPASDLMGSRLERPSVFCIFFCFFKWEREENFATRTNTLHCWHWFLRASSTRGLFNALVGLPFMSCQYINPEMLKNPIWSRWWQEQVCLDIRISFLSQMERKRSCFFW